VTLRRVCGVGSYEGGAPSKQGKPLSNYTVHSNVVVNSNTMQLASGAVWLFTCLLLVATTTIYPCVDCSGLQVAFNFVGTNGVVLRGNQVAWAASGPHNSVVVCCEELRACMLIVFLRLSRLA
jgi:hypothetical protein